MSGNFIRPRHILSPFSRHLCFGGCSSSAASVYVGQSSRNPAAHFERNRASAARARTRPHRHAKTATVNQLLEAGINYPPTSQAVRADSAGPKINRLKELKEHNNPTLQYEATAKETKVLKYSRNSEVDDLNSQNKQFCFSGRTLWRLIVNTVLINTFRHSDLAAWWKETLTFGWANVLIGWAQISDWAESTHRGPKPDANMAKGRKETGRFKIQVFKSYSNKKFQNSKIP